MELYAFVMNIYAVEGKIMFTNKIKNPAGTISRYNVSNDKDQILNFSYLRADR